MPVHRFGRVLIVAGLVFAATACSEQGLVPTSPVAPSSQAGTAAKPPAPPTSIPVTSTVANAAGFRIQSDGLGPYVSSKTLKSEIQPVGDWVLDALIKSKRKVYLDFGDPIPGSAPGGGDPVPLLSGLYKFRALMQCSVAGNKLPEFNAGDEKLCPLRIAFDVGVDHYVLLMNKSFPTLNGPFPTTDDVKVTCTSSSSPCSQWQFTPNNPSGANVAKLARTDGGGTLLEDRGDFNLSFSILIAKQ